MTSSTRATGMGVTVDCVVFGLDEDDVKVLLIQRGNGADRSDWALPGGNVESTEGLDDAARRELVQETGLRISFLEQLYTFGRPDRHPRRRVVTVAYYALVKLIDHTIRPLNEAATAAWFGLDDMPSLILDHDEIIEVAVERLRAKIRYQPIGFDLLPPKFTLRQLQHLYETLLDRPLDKRNFRKKILAMGVLDELDEVETDVAHRAARLYRFDRRRYKRLSRQGFNFEV